MDIEEFRKNAHNTVDWIAYYFQNIEQYPVKSYVNKIFSVISINFIMFYHKIEKVTS